MNSSILIRYHEVALKHGNRKWFEEKLASNIKKIIGHTLEKKVTLHREHNRILLDAEWNRSTQTALGRTFGIASFSSIRKVPTQKELLIQTALEEFHTEYQKNQSIPRTFRVLTRRSDKALPETSMELDRLIGAAIQKNFPMIQVNLENPEITLGIEVRFYHSFVWTEKIMGPGGLPVGTNGHLLTLVSGGLDSPVAAIQMLKRGANTEFIHFYGTPFVDPAALEKVEDLCKRINQFQPDPQPLHVVSFGKIQEKIALATNSKIRTILYRRMMIRIAEAIARQEGRAQALVTGESLGQVASQTLENMTVIDECAELPILRPLIGFDKNEIIAQAHRWETFETSIRPSVDCCTLFADRHPTLRASIDFIKDQENHFPLTELVQLAMREIQVYIP